MALGNDLLMVSLVVGGGYIFLYHVVPALQSGQLGGGFAPGGSFLPTPAAAASSGGHRCWEIGNGTRACACAGKQYTVMGPARTCPDCIQYCNTGVLPPVSSPLSQGGLQGSISARGSGSAGAGARATGGVGVLQRPPPSGTGVRAGAGASARVGVSIPAQKVTNNCGGTICVAMYNNAQQKVWRCSNKCKSWFAGTGYLCKGRAASSQATGAYCNP